MSLLGSEQLQVNTLRNNSLSCKFDRSSIISVIWKCWVVIRLERIYNFWCSMLVYAPFALCFVTLRGVFILFSGTNLLTRCIVPVPCFLLFLCFKKVTQEIFSELDETKPEVPISPDTRRSPKQRRRRARRWPHHLVARVHPWPRHHLMWEPLVPSYIAPPPI
jgi:hypothetical protein